MLLKILCGTFVLSGDMFVGKLGDCLVFLQKALDSQKHVHVP